LRRIVGDRESSGTEIERKRLLGGLLGTGKERGKRKAES